MALEELLLLKLANDNPAFEPFRELFDDRILRDSTSYLAALDRLESFFDGLQSFGPERRPWSNCCAVPRRRRRTPYPDNWTICARTGVSSWGPIWRASWADWT
jgi:hypothetical protein